MITLTTEQVQQIEEALEQLGEFLNAATPSFVDESKSEALSTIRAARAQEQTHDLYTNADKDRPAAICDRNGDVVLRLCKRCGRGECELSEPCITEQAEQDHKCKDHPDAPHGFCRDESITQDRYVCECEFWEPPKTAEQEPVAWHLDAETAKFLADMITADDEPTEITLRLGFIRDDDGKVQYGLLVEDSEYPEEGACLLVECEPLNAAPVSAKRELVELTDDEIMKINVDTASIVPTCDRQFHFARAAIAADREKNRA